MLGFIIYPTYVIKDGKPQIVLYGRLSNGESFKVLKEFEPYFFIKQEDVKTAQKLINYKIEKTNYHDFDGNSLAKVTTNIPSDVKKARDSLEQTGIACYEADIKFAYRFLIDNDIKGYVDIDGQSYKAKRMDNIFLNPKLKPSYGNIKLKVLSIDIETDEGGFENFSSPILCISLYSKNLKEVLILDKKCNNAQSFSSERNLLLALRERILAFDPDIIIGWNIVDFDLVYLKKRFEANGMVFNIGRGESEVRFVSQKSFIRASVAKVEGRIVLDAMHLLRDYFYKFEDYRLDTAAKKLIGDGKIELDKKISEIYEKYPEKLAEYNLHDSYLVYKIAEKESLIELGMTLSSITGMQLDRVKASIATLDSLYLRKARKEGIVCPSVTGGHKVAVSGGFVEEPKYGFYDYVLLCDFRSLYPSIIATFNIDPITYDKGKICAPNNTCFGSGKSILPRIILELLDERSLAKKRNESTKQFAIKIIMNSIFGVLGNPNCRFYNPKIANAITSFGRYILKKTSKKVEEAGYGVIYGDTDSIFVVSNAENINDAKKMGQKIQSEINNFYQSFVLEKYERNSYLQLEFKKVFEKFFLPKQRHLEKGAKKRYAGMVDGKLHIVGLEYVRRDWTQLSKEFQYNLLLRIFKDEDYEDYIRNYVKMLKNRELDDLLIYRKRLRKGVEQYTKTTPPHVKAARMLQFKGKENASLIEYVMTKKGPQPVQLAKNIDYSHYIEKQIKPIAESMLSLLEENFEDIITKTRQQTLRDFL
ncbi:MAG: DNA polymerase II [Candidatus Methanofastidiosia archaeon]